MRYVVVQPNADYQRRAKKSTKCYYINRIPDQIDVNIDKSVMEQPLSP